MSLKLNKALIKFILAQGGRKNGNTYEISSLPIQAVAHGVMSH